MSEWVSQSVSDKHCQWSDSGPIITKIIIINIIEAIIIIIKKISFIRAKRHFWRPKKRTKLPKLGSGGFRWFGQCPKENVFFKLRSSLTLKDSQFCSHFITSHLPIIAVQQITCNLAWVPRVHLLRQWELLIQISDQAILRIICKDLWNILFRYQTKPFWGLYVKTSETYYSDIRLGQLWELSPGIFVCLSAFFTMRKWQIWYSLRLF